MKNVVNKHENVMNLLEQVNVLCRDNGKKFLKEQSPRIEIIKEKLATTSYECTEGDLYLLYHKKPLAEYGADAILISSHIDCVEDDMTQCFSKVKSKNKLLGTYDNSITNTAVMQLMLEDSLPDNVMVAFTGAEERDSLGATQVTKLLHNNGVKFKGMILDVTYEGWKDKADFTIENNFWDAALGRKVIAAVDKKSSTWLFVSSDPYNVPVYVPEERVAKGRKSGRVKEALPDESWQYDEQHIKCFSLCLPVHGEMHSNDGVKARISSLFEYIETLKLLATELAE